MILDRLTNLSNRAVMLILIGIALASTMVSAVVNAVSNVETPASWWVNLLQNFSTEMFGAFLTFVLLQIIVGNRQEKERLIREMGSRDNATAIKALTELDAHGWLRDGSLRKAYLGGANLQGAFIHDADLQEVGLDSSNLKRVTFLSCNLRKVDFDSADMEETILGTSYLEQACLVHANLQGAYLDGARLRGADLSGANLEGAKLVNNVRGFRAEFDEDTILPDTSRWTPDTDMRRFTDATHPNFWRSIDPNSPAYRRQRED